MATATRYAVVNYYVEVQYTGKVVSLWGQPCERTMRQAACKATMNGHSMFESCEWNDISLFNELLDFTGNLYQTSCPSAERK